MSSQLQLPDPVRELVGGGELVPVRVGRSTASTFRCEVAGEPHVLKLGEVDPLGTSLVGEAERMRWLAPYIAVPVVVDAGTDGSVEWLLTAALRGSDATDPVHHVDLEALIHTLGAALRTFHDTVPVEECPFDARTSTSVALAAERVAGGRVDADDFAPLYEGLSAEQLLDAIRSVPEPPDDDLVVVHGDYCVPNVIVDDGSVTGYVDLGRSGVGDRHRDLSIACRSIAVNFGAHAAGVFLDAYGIDRPDLARIDFFAMLDELF